mmetsp:Transcript_110009/g.275566  ORF Transcript_110009/g.275566 Transcript_110009/m.275566 type:complete len:210 (-) Transcript_110009:475-1104(-)
MWLCTKASPRNNFMHNLHRNFISSNCSVCSAKKDVMSDSFGSETEAATSSGSETAAGTSGPKAITSMSAAVLSTRFRSSRRACMSGSSTCSRAVVDSAGACSTGAVVGFTGTCMSGSSTCCGAVVDSAGACSTGADVGFTGTDAAILMAMLYLSTSCSHHDQRDPSSTRKESGSSMETSSAWHRSPPKLLAVPQPLASASESVACSCVA